MNTLELKGVILTQIAEMDDPETLKEVVDFLNSKLIMPESESDGWSDLPPQAQQELLEAIERSKKNDPDNWISHEEVMKQARQWLQNQR